MGAYLDTDNYFRRSYVVMGEGNLRNTGLEIVRTEIRIEDHRFTKYFGDASLSWDTYVKRYAYT